MKEIIFVVEAAPEGGFTARALGASVFTEADTVEELHDNVRDILPIHRVQVGGQTGAGSGGVQQ